MKNYGLLALALMLIVVVSACGPATDTPLKIAILAPLTGPLPSYGASARDGALLAIKQSNAKGGVLGRQIEAVVEDSRCTADPAVAAANKVIQEDGIRYIIGEVCSAASIPISEIAEAQHVVMVSPTSTNPSVTVGTDGSTKSYVFRACFIDPFQGEVAARFAHDDLGKSTAYILRESGNTYGSGLASAFEESFANQGGQVVGEQTYSSGQTDFSACLSAVAAAAPDILYVPGFYNEVNLIGAKAKEMDISSIMIGGDGWESSDLDLAAVDGGYFTSHFSALDTRPIVEQWIVDYQEEYGDVPDSIATLSYDAANLVLAAITEANTDDPTVVKDSLANIQWEAVSGAITFDAQHNPIKAAVVLQAKDGQIDYVTTLSPE